MAVPSSGAISMAGIGTEVKSNAYNPSATGTVTLGSLANNTTINTNSASVPDSEPPHAMSEWYGYDHDAAPSFTNNQAVSKTTSTGTSNAITFTDTDDTFNITGSDNWSISFWVKAGWTSSLNTNIHFLIGQRATAAKQTTDMVKIIYAENTNRIEVRYGNVAGSSFWYNQGGWLFHANSGSFAAGFKAAGLGTTFWSASNRGNVNSDDYTMITVTNDGTNTAASLRLYWNATGIGTAPVQTNNNSSARAGNPISSTNDRQWSLGSNGAHSNNSTPQAKCGNGSATVYNDLTIWDKQLSDSEVTELYNSGTVLNAETHSASSNLIGYWKWEGDGDATVSNDNFTISGGSSIVNK